MTDTERKILLKKMKSSINEAKSLTKVEALSKLFEIGIVTQKGRLKKQYNRR